MKILIVTQYFWPESFRINDLALSLQKRGHEVSVLTGMPNYPHGRFFEGYGFLRPFRQSYRGVRVYRVPLLPRGQGGSVRLALNYVSFAVTASLFGPILCRDSYDLILVYEPSPVTVGLPAIVLKKLKHAPIMFWVQDLWPESLSAVGAVRSERVMGWVARMVRYIYERCDKVLVQSVGFIPRIEAQGAKAADILYLPNWAEEFYHPVHPEDSMIKRSKLPVGFLVMFAGNIAVAQSFDTILAAATKLKDYAEIHWVVLGDGRMRRWVEKRVKHLGLEDRVHLLGQQPAEAMPHYFAFADVLLATLKNDPVFALSIPSKIQPYLACGRPVVAALDGEGTRIVRESGAGVAAPAEDADALAERVLELYRMSPEERKRMGERGRAYFEENFEREKLLDRLEGWMSELVGKERA